MPFTSRWLVENRIIYAEVIGVLTTQDALEMSAVHAKFLDEGTAPIHLIINAKQLESVPTNIRQYTQMGDYLRHPSLSWVMVIGGSTVANFMLAALGHVFRLRYATRDSLSDGLSFLAAQDSSLKFDQTAQ